MNENNKSFYPLDMFEFIHHPNYGCRNLKGLIASPPIAVIYMCSYYARSMTHASCIWVPWLWERVFL
jgi:hypothetical protein